MSHSVIGNVAEKLGQSVFLRGIVLAFLALLLQVPIAEIESVISERQMTREAAVREVTNTWGGEQTLAGPVLVVPYLSRWRDDNGAAHESRQAAYFLPETLQVKTEVGVERRQRGIFEMPLYVSKMTIEGDFAPPDFSTWEIAKGDVQWEAATLVVGVADPKAFRSKVELAWDGAAMPFEPGHDGAPFLRGGIHVNKVPLHGGGGKRHFAMELNLGGSGLLQFLPLGRDTTVSMMSAWPDPSFFGAYLPETRAVNKDGFNAAWHVSYLGRNVPQQWLGAEVKDVDFNASAFGVSFLSPVDAYTATRRAVKYEILFVGLTFLVFFLIELFQRVRLHPIQYLMVGFGLCLFYLLLLAFSEHLGFGLAYGIASLTIVGVVGGYCSAILGKTRMALLAIGQLSILYGFMFVLLQVQDYALLGGALGLLLVLTLVMYVTRKIDWYHVRASQQRAPA
jgi:inner membrane protein